MGNCDGFVNVPIFYGDDPEEWISWVESFCSDYSDFEKLQFGYGFVEGEALDWYFDETSHSPINSLEELKVGLLQRFSKSKKISEAVLKQSDERGSKRSSIWSCLDRIEKSPLQTEEQLEKENLRAAEEDNLSFNCEEIISGFHEIEKEETPQHEEGKQTKANNGEPTCHVFDKMPKRKKKKNWHKEISLRRSRINHIYHKHEVGRNKVKDRRNSLSSYQMFVRTPQRGNKTTMKRKKKKWKKLSRLAESKSRIELIGNMKIVQGFTKRKYGNMTICFMQGLEGQLSYEKQTAEPKQTYVVMVIHACQRFDQMSIRGKENTKKKKKKRWKNLPKENYSSYGRSKGCMTNERVLLKNMTSCWNCHELELSAGKVNKKPCVKMKIHVFVKCFHGEKS